MMQQEDLPNAKNFSDSGIKPVAPQTYTDAQHTLVGDRRAQILPPNPQGGQLMVVVDPLRAQPNAATWMQPNATTWMQPNAATMMQPNIVIVQQPGVKIEKGLLIAGIIISLFLLGVSISYAVMGSEYSAALGGVSAIGFIPATLTLIVCIGLCANAFQGRGWRAAVIVLMILDLALAIVGAFVLILLVAISALFSGENNQNDD